MAVAAAAVTVSALAFGGWSAAKAGAFPSPVTVHEQEPATVSGRNDTPGTNQRISGFGTAAGAAGEARVQGVLAGPTSPTMLPAAREDDGSQSSAADTGLKPGRSARTTGTIGDGPHASAGDKTGDFDFYVVRGATMGQVLSVYVDTPDSELRPTVRFWMDGEPEGVASNGNGSYLITTDLHTDGDFYFTVGAQGSEQADPNDSGSGNGATSEGSYTATFSLDAGDTDVYAIDLAAGDVLSGSVSGSAARLQIFDRAKKLAVGAMADTLSSWFPKDSPLLRGGNAAVNHIAARAGRYYVAVSSGKGEYDVRLNVNRPGPESKRATQIIFVDLDGASLDPAIFHDSQVGGVRKLSPLAAFISRWGITGEAQQGALVEQIITSLTENLQGDFAGTGSKVTILNSRDHRDPFGQPHVSRVVIGGIQAELGRDGTGSAQSIDPGNFAMAETALILLDTMSAPPGEMSLNTHLGPTSDRVRFVGTAIANLASHEVGHLLGAFHAFGAGGKPNLMMPGTESSAIYGVGADNVGGTADDVDLDFEVAPFGYDTWFTGVEDCRARIRWTLS